MVEVRNSFSAGYWPWSKRFLIHSFISHRISALLALSTWNLLRKGCPHLWLHCKPTIPSRALSNTLSGPKPCKSFLNECLHYLFSSPWQQNGLSSTDTGLSDVERENCNVVVSNKQLELKVRISLVVASTDPHFTVNKDSTNFHKWWFFWFLWLSADFGFL